MLLPTEEKKQAEFSVTAAQTAERTASYCERNPTTCQAGRELWATFVRKAEYGLELGAGLVREQVLRAMLEPRPQAPAGPQPASGQAKPAAAGQTTILAATP